MTDVWAAFAAARLNEEERQAAALAASIERQNMGGWSSLIPGTVTGTAVTINTMWLPDRVLREVAAKRAILAEHQPVGGFDPNGPVCGTCGEPGPMGTEDAVVRWPCPTVRHLAAIWSDHADYPGHHENSVV